MAIALAILGTLFGLLLIGGGIAIVCVSFYQQHKIQQSIEHGFQETAQHILNASIALNTEAAQRDAALAEQLASRHATIWIPPNEGCEICRREAVAVCSHGNHKPVWLCGWCSAE